MKKGLQILRRLNSHPLIDVLIHLKGNPGVCVFIEPLWGIPFNLIAPFATVYMYALGVTDVQIGLIASIAMVIQLIFSFLGGTIADKIGRKNTTMLGDMLGWSVACFVWAISQNFWFFLIASALNAFEQINQTAWTCLLIEDADKKQVVSIYTWITIAGLMAVFFAPVSGLLIGNFTLVPVMRILYFIFSAAMIVKTIITYKCTTETKQGYIRMQETKNTSFLKLLMGYKALIPKIFNNRSTMQTLVVMTVIFITNISSNNFFGLYATEALGLPEGYLAYFPIFRAVVMIIFLFIIQHKIHTIRVPMQVGFIAYIVAQALLILSPIGQPVFIVVFIILEAVAYGLVMPRKDAMVTNNVDPHERARIVALLTTFMITLSAPFGYVAGLFSSIDRRLVFALNIVFFLTALITVSLIKEKPQDKKLQSL